MLKEEIDKLVIRFGTLFHKDKNYYAMDYGTRFDKTIKPNGKIDYKKKPGDKTRPFWFLNHEIKQTTYNHHLTFNKSGSWHFDRRVGEVVTVRPSDEITDLAIIVPPCDLDGDSKTKGLAKWGAMDEDQYDKPEHLKRIVKQIYDEKLPLAPCYSKSGGLHLYIFTKEMTEGDSIVKALTHYKKILKATAKEINPKQTKPTWEKRKNRWSPGNGICLPYKSCIENLLKAELNPEYNPEDKHSYKYKPIPIGEYIKTETPWIKNENMEAGTLEEFLDYAEAIQVDQNYFDKRPLNLPEEEKSENYYPGAISTEDSISHMPVRNALRPKEEEEETEEDIEDAMDEFFAPTEPPNWSGEPPKKEKEKIDFSEPNARPLSDKNPLSKIIQKIKNKKEHSKGGTFDNHVVDFVYGAIESKMSDKHILEHLETVEKYSDKASEDDYFQEKIRNCRGKYDKTDPGPQREKFMEDTIVILNQKTKKYYNKKTGKAYDKDNYNLKFAEIFEDKEPTTYFKYHPKKQLAEEETYRPDLHRENDPLIKGADELYYLNSYKPSKIKPIKPETEGDIKPWNTLLEHIAPIKAEREFLLDWLAHIVKNPWVKNRVIILIYTKKQRMGKGSIFDTMADILGETNAIPTDVKGILDKGVTYAEKQFVLIDECKSVGGWGEKSNLVNDLKKVATETRIQQRKLYVDYQTIETQTCYLILTNEPDALNMDKEDERYFVIKNENERLEKSWYKAYHKWRQDKGSSYVYYMLKTRDLSKFDPNEPALSTKAKKEMQGDTGPPLSLKLKEMLLEGRYPLTLDTNIISSTELKEYISKYHKGKHVQYINDPKQLNRSLKDIGAIELGQVLHKQHNWKPSLFIIRDHEEMQKISKPKLCNEIWKPIQNHSSPSEKHEDIATDKFFKNQTNGADQFEKKFNDNNEDKKALEKEEMSNYE